MTADRPFGLSVVTVWTAAWGFVTTIVGVVLLVAVLVAEVATEDLSDALDQDVSPTTGEAVGAVVASLVTVSFGIVLVVTALGVWALQAWGRRLAQIVYVIETIVSVLGLLAPPYHPAETSAYLFFAVASVSIVAYLSLPGLRARFQRREPVQIVTPAPDLARAAPAVVEAVAPGPPPVVELTSDQTESTGLAFCTACGSPNDRDDSFCVACGRPLVSTA